VYGFCCWLLLQISVRKQCDDARLNESLLLSENNNNKKNGFILRVRLRLLIFKGALLVDFNKIIELGIPIVGVQQLKDIFSVVCRDTVQFSGTIVSNAFWDVVPCSLVETYKI
jgi:hypothetical protein